MSKYVSGDIEVTALATLCCDRCSDDIYRETVTISYDDVSLVDPETLEEKLIEMSDLDDQDAHYVYDSETLCERCYYSAMEEEEEEERMDSDGLYNVEIKDNGSTLTDEELSTFF